MKSMIIGIFVLASTSTFSMECPKKISFAVSEFKTADISDTQAIDKMVKESGNQTDAEYFIAVLEAAKNTEMIKDILVLQINNYNNCKYKGKTTSAEMTSLNPYYPNERTTLKIKAIPVKYESRDFGRNGNAVNFSIPLKSIKETFKVINKTAKMFVSVLVQIPLIDGTDGYDADIELGSARKVSVSFEK